MSPHPKEAAVKRNLLCITLLACFALCAAPLCAQEAPAAKRNDALELRLNAALTKTSGTWGVSVKHVERREFASIHADEKFQMASVFKIPVLVELFQQVKDGKVSLDERVEWRNPELYFGSGLLVSLDTGLRPTVRDLATLMITISDNAATDLLCAKLGLANITARLRALGLEKTSVDGGTRELILQALGLRGEAYRNVTTRTLREVPWDKIADEVAQNRRRFLEECPNCTTPAEMTLLLEKIVTGQTADKDSTDQMLRILSRQQFNQRLPRWVTGRFDHKTGTLNAPVWVVNDAGILYLPGGEHVIICVFSRGSEQNLSSLANKLAIANAEERIAEVARIVFDYYSAQPRP
jgi:beta-lactamase class A